MVVLLFNHFSFGIFPELIESGKRLSLSDASLISTSCLNTCKIQLSMIDSDQHSDSNQRPLTSLSQIKV